jgi:hypothetical protein
VGHVYVLGTNPITEYRVVLGLFALDYLALLVDVKPERFPAAALR